MPRHVTALAFVVAALVVMVSPVQAASLSPEAREKVLVREMNHLLVPGPAGWTMVRDVEKYQRLENQLANVRFIIYTPEGAINYVFGAYATQAHRVVSCESGHYIYASNGQYLGMFQMGYFARSTYGHGNTPLAQSRAAWRYFVASGKDWSPWSCKP
jgi:hypothetical protein